MSYLGVKKQFKDFPTGEWMEAAGKCGAWGDEYADECDGKVEVKLQNVGQDRNSGIVQIRCSKGHETDDLIGWTVGKDRVSLGRLGNFFPLTGRANMAYCGSCGKIIVDIPLILWGPNAPKDVRWELDFCWECAEKLKILDWMQAAQGPATTMVAKSRTLMKQ